MSGKLPKKNLAKDFAYLINSPNNDKVMYSSTFNQVARPAVRDRSMIKLLVMNSFTFILLFLSFQLFAGDGLAQRVTLNFRNARVEDVIKEIQRQTTYNFLYFESDLRDAKAVTLQCKDNPLDQVLEVLKTNQPFDLVVEGTTILLRSHSSKEPIPEQVGPPAVNISGRITDPNGTPLGGATIIIKRTQRGTQANANGEFKLTEVREDDVLIISFVGFQSKSVTVGKGQQFPIVLEIASKELDMFVRRGYGVVSERFNVGNATVVRGEEIARTNVSNPMRALIGKIPNVDVSATAGNVYAPTNIEIRGREFIGSNLAPNPYILIDGVPMTILDIGGQSGEDGSRGITQNKFNGPANGQDLMFNLNPEDIESITVLKDAAATAIYGSLGGSGVILITTKRGKPGKLKLNISASSGVSRVTRFHDMLSTEQYVEMRKEALKNDNRPINNSTAPDLTQWGEKNYTDFQRFLFGKDGKNNSIQVSLSGGEKNTVYRISGGFQKVANITNYSGSNDKASLQSSFQYATNNQKVKIGLVSLFSYSKVDEISTFSTQSLLPPNAPAIFDSLGRLNYQGWQPLTGYFGFSNLLMGYISKTDFFTSQLSIEYELLKGLKLSANLGFSTIRNGQIQKTPIISQDPEFSPTGSAQFGNNNSSRWIVEPQLTYQRLIGQGKLELLLGTTIHKNTQNGNSIIGFGYVNDNLLNSVSNAPGVEVSDGWGQYRYAAVFGRLNYNFRDRYLLEVSARRDGSSRFGPGNRYGTFGAVGVGWILSEEKWMQFAFPVLSFLKLRSSIGSIGTDNIGDYSYLSRWSASINYAKPYQGTQAYVPLHHTNPDLKWQINKKFEVGSHLGFWNDRIFLQATWYRDDCGNQLVTMPISAITGFSTVNANRNAVVRNSGWEFSLQSTILKAKDISWIANFNLGLNQNKLVSFPDLDKSPYATVLVVGERLFRPSRLRFLGVDPQTGLYVVEDVNKDGEISQVPINQGGDKYYLDDAHVKYSGGFGSEFRFKGLEINVFFNYVRNPRLISGIYSSTIPGRLSASGNQSVKVLDRWQKPGDIARFAKFTSRSDLTYSYLLDSDGIYSDGSYIRLRNISFGYELPDHWINKLNIKSVKIIGKADNILTFSKFEGVDPEIPTFGSVPSQKVVTFGIQIIL
ncbi:SusC/RagA family TonB-linked outer membrane protein [Pseudoflavitalea sp. X16]|uniref:SusC/RagA family TonB-linked outer membrane protein n=1 Tax=Paraflavitalea devenefica TaxID=2716334 RepID=UPI00141EEE24|nr:SusC/RagA family TonB-linked outer membrane protein [Paraflavitalea devenefica]NII26144.1 SusC/RagA family TonB-linked outer membrane protein [Paraflavitalea devenefica]